MKSPFLLIQIYALVLGLSAHAQVGNATRQLIVAQAAGWNSTTATLQCYQRASANAPWQPMLAEGLPVNLGRSGLAWGRGVFVAPQNGIPAKLERDGKAPAGIFQLGQLFGYASGGPKGSHWPYLQVGKYDAWVDDARSPYYNQHVRVNPQAIPDWFEKQRMRLGDSAYKWMLVIQHNTQPPAAGYGSAIFFHVRRGVNKPSAGCTTMEQSKLEMIIRWLDPSASPLYVLLPQADYAALRKPWRLP